MAAVLTREKTNDMTSVLQDKDFNASAMATTLNALSFDLSLKDVLFGDEWTTVPCGEKEARVLRDPNKAFDIYAKEWSIRFGIVQDVLSKAKGKGNATIKKKVVSLFDNLNYMEATLREMYKNAYLTFAATPCEEKSQEEKRRIDRVIAVASIQLIGIKMILDAKGLKDVDSVSAKVMALLDKISAMIMDS